MVPAVIEDDIGKIGDYVVSQNVTSNKSERQRLHNQNFNLNDFDET